MALIKQVSIKNTSGSYDTRDIGADAKNVSVGVNSSGDIPSKESEESKQTTVKEVLKGLQGEVKRKAESTTLSDHINKKASNTVEGHIKLGTGFTQSGGATSVAFASDRQSGEGLAVKANDSRLSDRRANPNALTFDNGSSYDGSSKLSVNASTVGAASKSHVGTTASSSTLGHVKVGTGLSVSSGTLSVNYGSSGSTACAGNDGRLSNRREPTAHATTTAAYGGGNSSNFGHVRLSDWFDGSPNLSQYGANSHWGASLYAVQQAYSKLNTNLNQIHDFIGTGSHPITSFKSDYLNYIRGGIYKRAGVVFLHVEAKVIKQIKKWDSTVFIIPKDNYSPLVAHYTINNQFFMNIEGGIVSLLDFPVGDTLVLTEMYLAK